jgi:hypothetical protein
MDLISLGFELCGCDRTIDPTTEAYDDTVCIQVIAGCTIV